MLLLGRNMVGRNMGRAGEEPGGEEMSDGEGHGNKASFITAFSWNLSWDLSLISWCTFLLSLMQPLLHRKVKKEVTPQNMPLACSLLGMTHTSCHYNHSCVVYYTCTKWHCGVSLSECIDYTSSQWSSGHLCYQLVFWLVFTHSSPTWDNPEKALRYEKGTFF